MSSRCHKVLPFVSVIIPTFNSANCLCFLIEKLLHQTYCSTKYEIIVVDNKSTDGTKEICANYPIIYCLESNVQSSYAARNKGVKVSKGEILAFIDVDCVPALDWLSNGISHMLAKSSDMVAGDVEVDFSITSLAGVYDSVMNLQIESAVRDRRAAMTANLFVHSRVFKKLGLFDSEARSGADLVFTRYATNVGFSLAFSKEAKVIHPARSLAELCRKAARTSRGKAYWSLARLEKIKLSEADLRNVHARRALNYQYLARKVRLRYPGAGPLISAGVYSIHLLLIIVSIFSRLVYALKN